jgi:hypothetical protein
MLGVNTTTESVSRFKVAWRRTLGWRNSGVAHSGISKTHTRSGGQPAQAGEDDI